MHHRLWDPGWAQRQCNRVCRSSAQHGDLPGRDDPEASRTALDRDHLPLGTVTLRVSNATRTYASQTAPTLRMKSSSRSPLYRLVSFPASGQHVSTYVTHSACAHSRSGGPCNPLPWAEREDSPPLLGVSRGEKPALHHSKEPHTSHVKREWGRGLGACVRQDWQCWGTLLVAPETCRLAQEPDLVQGSRCHTGWGGSDWGIGWDWQWLGH